VAHSVGQPCSSVTRPGASRPASGSLGHSLGLSLGDSLGSLGDAVGSLGDSLGSLGDSLGSLGLSLGDWLGSLGDAVGLPDGLCSGGTWVGRAGTGEVEPSTDSSTDRGLAGTGSATSGTSLSGPIWLDGPACDGVEDDFSSGATGETGEIRLIPDSSVA
jgi:hypothetical protein